MSSETVNQVGTVPGDESLAAIPAAGVCWNLDDLYPGISSPEMSEDAEGVRKLARAFADAYRGKINLKAGLTPEFMADAMRRYEELYEIAVRQVAYARLQHAADTRPAEHGALLARVQDLFTEVQTRVMFFELDWIALPDEIAEPICSSSVCRRWRHYLRSVRRYRPHTLSEPEEIVLAEKSSTGLQAFRRLFDETMSSQIYELKLDGSTQSLNQSEILAILYDSNRERRRAAQAAFTKGLKKSSRLATFIFNTTVQDHAVNTRLRKYSSPAESRHLANEIDAESVKLLLEACESRRDIVQDYYRLKARLFGVDELYDYDRYAPVEIEGVTVPACSWQEARGLVTRAYQGFSERLGEIVDLFFERDWIDAESRDGKRGGAFCSPSVPSVHPYILVNFNGKLNDSMTLAHELGHGVHQYLSRKQGLFQASTPLTLAETASVFGEMLTFSSLLERESDPALKLSLICNRLEDSFATVFRQVVMTRFEEALHRDRKEGELSTERMDDLWFEANAPMHGDAVKLTQEYRRWWTYVGHFIHSPFYCYAYSFGELLVLALWRQYQKEGKDFIPKYLRLLEAGGSDTPAVLIADVGLDINDAGFWHSGLEVLDDLLSEAGRLASEIGV